MFKMLAQDSKSTFCSWLCHKKICDLRRLNLAFLGFDFPSFLRMETVVPPRGILRNVLVLSAFPRVQLCEPSQRSAQGPFTLSERLLTNLHLFHHHLQCPDSGVICSCPNPYPVSMQQFWNPSHTLSHFSMLLFTSRFLLHFSQSKWLPCHCFIMHLNVPSVDFTMIHQEEMA